ncbi:MAG: hypothetical protein DWQ36_09960 [Acidobacteria bacterium]|nr:MAG: hypothetical protein DWQ30_01240 [Acidobacteriota bacterium]REK08381.1 MAG: hypothetical protein DWQ36_09960 [Acidobacteriota bacterium]
MKASVLLVALSGLLSAAAGATVLVSVSDLVEGALRDLEAASPQERYAATVVFREYPEAASGHHARIAPALRDGDWVVRLGAARAFEEIVGYEASPAVLTALAQLLRDSSQEVRAAASFALAAVGSGPAETRAPLLEGAESGSEYLAVGSCLALHRLFPTTAADACDGPTTSARASELLWLALDDEQRWGEEDRREGACEEGSWTEEDWKEPLSVTAARLARAAAVLDASQANGLVHRLARRHEDGSFAALSAGRAMSPYLVDHYEDWTSDLHVGSLEERRLAIVSIGVLGIVTPDAVASLGSLLFEPGLAADAARTLRLLGPGAQAAVPSLEVAVLEGSDVALRRMAVLALIDIDAETASDLASRLASRDEPFARWLQRAVLLSRF